MPKLKKSLLLISLLTLSLLLTGNTMQAASNNPDSNAVQSVSDNSDRNAVQSVSDNSGNITVQSVSDNSDRSTVQTVSDNSDDNNEQAETDNSDRPIIRLICPTEYPFFIARNGEEAAYLNSQIFSIANCSNRDISIDLSNIYLEPGENVSYNELSAPVDKDYVSDTKDVFAFLKEVDIDPDNVPSPDSLKAGEIPPEGASPSEGEFILTGENKTTDYKVLLKAANYNEAGEFVSLRPESIFSFYIAGSVTPNKDLIWNKGDINIKVIVNYSVVPSDDIKSPDATSLSGTESKEKDK